MNSKIINPWTWQDKLGYAQAIDITQQNLEQVIQQAGYHPANIARLTIYTTSMEEFFAAYGTAVSWFQQYQLTPSSTLVQVMALAYPELAVEIEATVVR
jgi:2-iminobutanoate/2-iminopropanoate deaminase